jgi:hypothetical protein
VTRDPLEHLGLRDPGVGELFSQLTSAPAPGELSGERAALTNFLAARGTQHHSPAYRASRTKVRVGGRLAAAATVLAIVGGFAAAGYAAVLPAPLQRVAHQILGIVGVPAPEHHRSGSTGPTGRTTTRHDKGGSLSPGSPHSSSPSTSRSPRSGSPSPRPSSGSPSSPSARLIIASSRHQITAGGSVNITALLTERGSGVTNAPLVLKEQAAGQATWQVVEQGTTDPAGHARFTVVSLATNAAFRVTGPQGAASGELDIVVIPRVSLSAVPGKGRTSHLLVAAPLAQRGDLVELEMSSSGQWRVLRSRRLRLNRQTAFSVVVRKINVTYRVVLLATADHGQSVSNQVTIPARARRTPGKRRGPGVTGLVRRRPRGGDSA